MSNSNKIVGSGKVLAGKYTLNGKVLTAPALSILSTYGLLPVIRKELPTGGKGKKINILELENGKVSLDFAEYTGPAVVDTTNETASDDATGDTTEVTDATSDAEVVAETVDEVEEPAVEVEA